MSQLRNEGGGQSEVPARILVAEVSERATAHAPQGDALDEARAEFRAAWQAKVDRIRRWAEILNRVESWLGRIWILFLLFSSFVPGMNLLAGLVRGDAIRITLYFSGALFLVSVFTLLFSQRLKQHADRLEASIDRPLQLGR